MFALLEDLPDEIFLEIFLYLSPFDLFLTFAHLNYRLNSILRDRSLRLGIRITSNHRFELDCFVGYFTHVHLCSGGGNIDLRQFTNVRSLTLGPSAPPTDELLNQLIQQPLCYFPYLTQLTIYQPLATWYSTPAIRLWNLLFTNRFSSRLERCSLSGRLFAMPNTCFFCRSLRGISIGGCSLRDFPTLLSSLPNLTVLSTDVWGVTDPSNVNSYHHLRLSHLRIKFTQQSIVLEELRRLLSYAPHLKRFTIRATRKHDMFSVEYWHDVLTSQLEHLEEFHCDIRLGDTIENNKIDIEQIREYDSLFSRMKLYRRNDSLFICTNNYF